MVTRSAVAIPEPEHAQGQDAPPVRAGATRAAVAAFVALAGLCAHGCRAERAPAKREKGCGAADRIISLAIVDGTPDVQRPVRLEPRRLAESIRKILSRSSSFRLDERKKTRCGHPYTCRVDLDLRGLTFEDKGRASILISMTMRRTGDAATEPALVSRGEASRTYVVARTANLGKLYLDLLERGLTDVFRFIEVEHRLRKSPPRVVAAAIEIGAMDPAELDSQLQPARWQPVLSAAVYLTLGLPALPLSAAGLEAARHAPLPVKKGGSDVQELAMKVAGMRKLKRTVAPLLKVLATGSTERLRDLALAALTQIGDRRVVPHLTRYAEFGDLVRLRKVIEALTQLGGRQARAFLELTADGHPDEEIRTMAVSALKGMEP